MIRKSALAFAAILSLATSAASADTVPAPSGVILTFSGDIDGPDAKTNAEGQKEVTFDIAALQAMDHETIETSTPWTDGVTKFEGVRMQDLVEAVGAKGEKLTVIAINDYEADIPMADFAAHDVVLAYKMDGEYMAVREKGPLFVIYPFDSDPDLATEEFFSRAVWQVKGLSTN